MSHDNPNGPCACGAWHGIKDLEVAEEVRYKLWDTEARLAQVTAERDTSRGEFECLCDATQLWWNEGRPKNPDTENAVRLAASHVTRAWRASIRAEAFEEAAKVAESSVKSEFGVLVCSLTPLEIAAAIRGLASDTQDKPADSVQSMQQCGAKHVNELGECIVCDSPRDRHAQHAGLRPSGSRKDGRGTHWAWPRDD